MTARNRKIPASVFFIDKLLVTVSEKKLNNQLNDIRSITFKHTHDKEEARTGRTDRLRHQLVPPPRPPVDKQ